MRKNIVRFIQLVVYSTIFILLVVVFRAPIVPEYLPLYIFMPAAIATATASMLTAEFGMKLIDRKVDENRALFVKKPNIRTILVILILMMAVAILTIWGLIYLLGYGADRAIISISIIIFLILAYILTSIFSEIGLVLEEGEKALQVIQEAGDELERYPKLFLGLDETTLRDIFAVALSTHFDSATAETFNYKGKTDLFVQHRKANVLIAECKFWKGTKEFHKAIDQLLSYLTIRDKQTAIICFIRDVKDREAVLEEIKNKISVHPCYLDAVQRQYKYDNWFTYNFHFPNVETEKLQLSVLCFYYPKSAEGIQAPSLSAEP